MRVENDNLEGVADQALALLTQMKRNPDVMPPYNEPVMRACIAKMNGLYSQNNECVTRLRSQGERASRELEALMICRNEALQHIRRCCLAYIHARAERIRSYRWRLGGVLPASIKNNLCEAEIEFFNDTHPPKALYVQYNELSPAKRPLKCWGQGAPHSPGRVRVLENYGEFETSDGNLVMLQVNSLHSLPRHDCEMLIRQGILEIAN
ncbi:hypothetical protein KIN20_007352 [Parelaphostrongylus tenuis]|uniref:DNA replication complex GINS protein PSF1 n=1 Tax=Parelaphostrongylus tenuis TaxID=148309 RepID=A0AAD5MP10_PARTN|nr:hypothetical protein KIN20_007352 [Parelaphostrongylus tenuis]